MKTAMLSAAAASLCSFSAAINLMLGRPWMMAVMLAFVAGNIAVMAINPAFRSR